MSKIDEKEENEMYKIISDALFSLCENKPKNPIKYLSAKMLELIGDNPDSLKIRHKVLLYIYNLCSQINYQ